ncbi:MAG: hypothetical protein M0C28_16000 [Candidatus Moduliflexus flocculans]|nr:hypothetical protein [Candidatus Moduliflexus flocculans]
MDARVGPPGAVDPDAGAPELVRRGQERPLDGARVDLGLPAAVAAAVVLDRGTQDGTGGGGGARGGRFGITLPLSQADRARPYDRRRAS